MPRGLEEEETLPRCRGVVTERMLENEVEEGGGGHVALTGFEEEKLRVEVKQDEEVCVWGGALLAAAAAAASAVEHRLLPPRCPPLRPHPPPLRPMQFPPK